MVSLLQRRVIEEAKGKQKYDSLIVSLNSYGWKSMKVQISYPPIPSSKGTPLLAQNRQFQWFSESTYIYPMVPASAATLLKGGGHEVVWDDAIAEGKSYDRWLRDFEKAPPDLMAIEAKTPIIKWYSRVIGELKKISPKTVVVLYGDHVTALPEESMLNSQTDFVITGGDYDFALSNLVESLKGKTSLEPGVWFREENAIRNTGPFTPSHDLNDLPYIDRDLTKWRLYSEKNGNYKKTPGTYTMVGRDCWWHRCSFCAWTALYPKFRTRSPESLVDEIETLIDKYGVREVFDDTGTFPAGNWLRKFCNSIIERGLKKEISMGCNMRFGALTFEDYKLMKRAGFRMLLFGVESGNERTLTMLDKNLTVDVIVDSCRRAREAGLEPHLTVMVGYPWESRQEALNTVNLAKRLLEKGWAITLQSTVVMPYPGTPLYAEALEKGWFRVDPRDYDRFDMREPVLNVPDMDAKEVLEICDDMYKIFLSPKYILRHLMRVRSISDLRFSFKAVSKILGHLKDFSPD